MTDDLQIRIQDGTGPTLIYLPGTHGDWTLNGAFRRAVKHRARLVEFTYPRTLDWSLADHADAIEQKLLENGITRGWVLAESFASQVAWAWVAKKSKSFRIDGIILAGGFVRHPIIPAVYAAKWLTAHMPLSLLKIILWFYTIYARLRENNSPELRADLEKFVERRTRADLLAAAHRLELIARNDLRPIARETNVPVFYLSGLIDPIVPWPFVRPWLENHCAGYCGSQMIFSSDHHVLGAGEKAAQHVIKWVNDGCLREPA